jgi:hypothetical protein
MVVVGAPRQKGCDHNMRVRAFRGAETQYP